MIQIAKPPQGKQNEAYDEEINNQKDLESLEKYLREVTQEPLN